MAKDITIGNVNFIDVEKLKIKEKDKDTYAEFVEMSPEDQAKIISDNIKSGVTILGQAGAVTPAKEEETKTVAPNFASGNVVVTPTSGKVMTQVTVNKDTINHIDSNIRSGKTLYGVTGNLQPAKAEETKTITSPDFSSGNIEVTPTTDKVMTQVTVNKDTTNHTPENIKDGITLYGIEGSLTPAKAEETKTITSPDFSSGNIEVTPTTDKVMTKVTINKDTTNHKSENIKDGVTLYGVTGTYEGGGGVTFSGYSITLEYDDFGGYLNANILCEYDGSYGWHYFQSSDYCPDGFVINNASLLVIKESYDAYVKTGSVGNLKTYDGTSISNSEAALTGAVNKLCYLTGNITLHFND